MKNERYLICQATGDQVGLADYFLLRVDRYLLDCVERLLREGSELQRKCGGCVDITERGEVVFDVLYDLPDGDTSPFFAKLEGWDFQKDALLLPADMEAQEVSELGCLRHTECNGIQVWPERGHVRLTCYPKEASYRIESTDSIHGILEKLREDFLYEQPDQ